jgi:photosystem II stability/assembly factor-like uncharacterized protein
MQEGITLLAASILNEYEVWGVGQSTVKALQRAQVDSVNAATMVLVLLHTLNGGKTWRPIQVKVQDPLLHDVKFVDAQRGWLIGDDYVYYSADGGKSWRPVLKL